MWKTKRLRCVMIRVADSIRDVMIAASPPLRDEVLLWTTTRRSAPSRVGKTAARLVEEPTRLGSTAPRRGLLSRRA